MVNPFMAASGVSLDRWLAVHQPETAFDIGANEGSYTDLLLRHNAKKVVAFEPLPRMADLVRARFSGDARVEIHQIALGEHDERRIDLSVLNCWTIAKKDGSALEDVPDFKGVRFDVDFRFIDSGAFGSPDFVKLDADGFEPAILRGAAKLIQSKRPAFWLELSYLPLELGDSCDRMVRDLYLKHRYVFVSGDGTFVCHDYRTMLGFFPWNTSYDVLAIPVELSRSFS